MGEIPLFITGAEIVKRHHCVETMIPTMEKGLLVGLKANARWLPTLEC